MTQNIMCCLSKPEIIEDTFKDNHEVSVYVYPWDDTTVINGELFSKIRHAVHLNDVIYQDMYRKVVTTLVSYEKLEKEWRVSLYYSNERKSYLYVLPNGKTLIDFPCPLCPSHRAFSPFRPR